MQSCAAFHLVKKNCEKTGDPFFHCFDCFFVFFEKWHIEIPNDPFSSLISSAVPNEPLFAPRYSVPVAPAFETPVGTYPSLLYPSAPGVFLRNYEWNDGAHADNVESTLVPCLFALSPLYTVVSRLGHRHWFSYRASRAKTYRDIANIAILVHFLSASQQLNFDTCHQQLTAVIGANIISIWSFQRVISITVTFGHYFKQRNCYQYTMITP